MGAVKVGTGRTGCGKGRYGYVQVGQIVTGEYPQCQKGRTNSQRRIHLSSVLTLLPPFFFAPPLTPMPHLFQKSSDVHTQNNGREESKSDQLSPQPLRRLGWISGGHPRFLIRRIFLSWHHTDENAIQTTHMFPPIRTDVKKVKGGGWAWG